MQPLYGKKVRRLRLGLLLLWVLFTPSCQRTLAVQPSTTPKITSTVVSGQPITVVQLVSPAPNESTDKKLTVTATPTNDVPLMPDVVTANGIQISLEQVEETESGYVLKGKVTKVPGLWLSVYLGAGTQLLDAQGGVIPTKYYSDGTGGTAQDAFADWGLQTIGKDYPGPWRLNISSLLIELSQKVSFTEDLGPAPQIGQSWDLNMPIDFAGYKFFIQKVELFQSEKDRPCLNFLFAGGPEIYRVSSVTDPENRSRHIDGQVSDANGGILSNSFCYDQVPAGIRSLNIYAVDVILQGPWTLHWQPSE